MSAKCRGRAFLTMEYISGEHLASLLHPIGRAPATKAWEPARQLCVGLAATHERGLRTVTSKRGGDARRSSRSRTNGASLPLGMYPVRRSAGVADTGPRWVSDRLARAGLEVAASTIWRVLPCQERSMLYLNVWALPGTVRSDPRFRALVRRMKFPA